MKTRHSICLVATLLWAAPMAYAQDEEPEPAQAAEDGDEAEGDDDAEEAADDDGEGEPDAGEDAEATDGEEDPEGADPDGEGAEETGDDDTGEEGDDDEAGDDEAGDDEAGDDLVPDPGDVVPPPVPAVPQQAPCASRARQVAVDAVVRVRSGNTWGAGFVYHSRRTVVTAFSLLRLGQGVRVVTRDGESHDAHVVARAEDYDLAILEVDQDLPAIPLEPAPETSAATGRTAIAMGHPFPGANRLLGSRGTGLLQWSISEGVVGASNADGIQADVALTAGHAGGPLLDCSGRLLGLITGSGILSTDIGLVTRTHRIDATIDGQASTGDWIGELRPLFGIGAAMLIDEDGQVALGGYLSLGAVLFDRISLMNHVGIFFGGTDGASGPELSRDRQRIRIESLLGYRFFIDVFGLTTLYIVPAGGISIQHDRLSTRTATAEPIEGCVPAAGTTCATIRFSETVDEEWLVRPAFGLSFLLGGNLEIGYVFELGTDTDPIQTYHVVNLGLLF